MSPVIPSHHRADHVLLWEHILRVMGIRTVATDDGGGGEFKKKKEMRLLSAIRTCSLLNSKRHRQLRVGHSHFVGDEAIRLNVPRSVGSPVVPSEDVASTFLSLSLLRTLSPPLFAQHLREPAAAAGQCGSE